MSQGPDVALLQWFDEFAEHGIFTTDEQLTITSWNDWLERHTGRPASEVVGRPLFDAYPDIERRGLDYHYVEALAGHAHLMSHLLNNHLLLIPAGAGEQGFSIMPQKVRIAPLRTGSRVVGTITVIDDVSERVASDQELRRQIEAQNAARTSAERALRAKDQFLATLSHEMRTPLNAVLGWARILSERALEPAMLARAADSILRNATVQARMIDDLLDTARIMSGKLRLQMQPVDLLLVTVASLDVLAPVLEAKRIELRKHFGSGTGRVLGDPDRLQQIIWNLLSNAAKFTDAPGTIDVRLEQVNGTARLTVADTGRGISPEFLPFIFDRFRQADASSSRREGGLGLGLALVRELVELHGGAVRAESEGLGKGSSFVVEFPTVTWSDAQATKKERAGAEGVPSLDGVHVLVVDDEKDARDLMVAMLAETGARVTAVGSCAEALAGVAGGRGRSRPDVLVSDIGMAGEDGYELINRVRALPGDQGGHLPAVALTGYASPEDEARVLSAGFQAFLTKPVDPAALFATIGDVLRPRTQGPRTKGLPHP